MKKIITMVIAIALVMACAVSADAESMVNVAHEDFGDKDSAAYAEVEALGANADAGVMCDAEHGIGAKAEAEAHILSVDGKLRGGSEENNVHASGNYTVGAARTGASVGAGIDENGKLNVGAELSAEAVACEISGKAGGTVCGVEANVTGGVKIGVGAKAECKYEDGKFKVELGASLGVGAEVGFEVDVNNMQLQQELDLQGPAVTGPESENVSRIGDFRETNANGLHTTSATYGTPTQFTETIVSTNHGNLHFTSATY